MIAFITWNSNLVPLIKVYVAQIHADLSSRVFFGVFCRNRTDYLGIDSAALSLWPTDFVQRQPRSFESVRLVARISGFLFDDFVVSELLKKRCFSTQRLSRSLSTGDVWALSCALWRVCWNKLISVSGPAFTWRQWTRLPQKSWLFRIRPLRASLQQSFVISLFVTRSLVTPSHCSVDNPLIHNSKGDMLFFQSRLLSTITVTPILRLCQ